MDTHQWSELFVRAFRGMDKRLEQVLQLNSCREHWVQAEISLHAYEQESLDIWTDLPIGNGRKADLYAQGENGETVMVAEVKCLGDAVQAKCLEGDWSVRADIERLQAFSCQNRFLVLVIAKGAQETETGRRLREDEWVPGRKAVTVDLHHALVRIWAL